MARAPVGVLGATGTVGQRFLALLKDHPVFQVAIVGASERSAGRPYGDAATWKLDCEQQPDAAVMGLVVQQCTAAAFAAAVPACKVVFSALDADVAAVIEQDFCDHGYAVFSNAKCFRMHPSVPLVVPLANPEHLRLVSGRRTSGYVVCNANCSTTGLVIVLGALADAFGPIDRVMVHTMQAASGAGYPGVPSLDLLDNVVPFIPGEEEKLETEPKKILGKLGATSIEHASLAVSASCSRVPVVDGHLLAVSVGFADAGRRPTSPQAIADALSSHHAISPADRARLSALCPERPIVALAQCDRPQPRLDRGRAGGMGVSVGRIRTCQLLDYKMCILSHNTVLGAAGSAILNAELALLWGFGPGA